LPVLVLFRRLSQTSLSCLPFPLTTFSAWFHHKQAAKLLRGPDHVIHAYIHSR
jgi:hypothetical protein